MAEGHRTEPPTTRVARRAFVVGIVGLPLWWLVGVASLVPLLVVVPMAWDLWARRRMLVPPHFAWWLLFLLWVLLGLGTLWSTAPGAVDADGGTRILVFGFRLSWYGGCSILLLWIGNTPASLLPDRLVHRVFASVFVVAVIGGVVGVSSPELTVTTLAERVLPHQLTANEFVHTLVSAEVADVQEVLGDPEPRPKAPFPYTNTWGSVLALSLVFFVAAMASAPRKWRWCAAPVVAAAAIPVVMSLNRGLWIALGAAAVGLLVLAALRRNPVALTGLVATVIFAGVALTSTPLGDTVQSRIDHPHSNDRRSQLLVATVSSMTEGSPAVGFGSTRDTAGTFESIAGGSTPDCAACGVPPLGTQGQLWLLLFSQGWVGAVLFLGFFVLVLARVVRCRDVSTTVATFVVGIFLLQMTVYDTLGLPMLLVMAAVGLAWRQEGRSHRLPRVDRTAVLVVAGVASTGALLGVLASATSDAHLASTVAVGLTPTPTYLDVGEEAAALEKDSSAAVPTTSSVDTEASLLLSERALSRAGARSGVRTSDLRDDVEVTAPPLSAVVEMTVTTPTPQDPSPAARAVAEEYLHERQEFLDGRRADLVARLRTSLAATDPLDPAWTTSRQYLRSAIDHLTTHRPEAGRVLRVGEVHRLAPDRSVPVTSGLALGVLVGLAGVRLARAGRRSSAWTA